MKLLIIDDEPHIRQMMRITLEAAGYQVDEAAEGTAGLERFGDGSDYDAIILDQKMPGLDGLETLRRIKQRSPAASVLMATAYGTIELAVDAMRLGATDFLRKPMTPETLRNAVSAAVAARASRTLASSGTRHGPVEIATLTMNGFQIHRGPDSAPSTSEHLFRVQRVADGRDSAVTVTIDPDVVDRVARLTHRRLEPDGTFWRVQAERLLSAFIWTEGDIPPDGRLTVHDISREDLDVAARWDHDERTPTSTGGTGRS